MFKAVATFTGDLQHKAAPKTTGRKAPWKKVSRYIQEHGGTYLTHHSRVQGSRLICRQVHRRETPVITRTSHSSRQWRWRYSVWPRTSVGACLSRRGAHDDPPPIVPEDTEGQRGSTGAGGFVSAGAETEAVEEGHSQVHCAKEREYKQCEKTMRPQVHSSS